MHWQLGEIQISILRSYQSFYPIGCNKLHGKPYPDSWICPVWILDSWVVFFFSYCSAYPNSAGTGAPYVPSASILGSSDQSQKAVKGKCLAPWPISFSAGWPSLARTRQGVPVTLGVRRRAAGSASWVVCRHMQLSLWAFWFFSFSCQTNEIW